MGATSTAPMPVAAPAAIRNILFATDFSPCSNVALTFASAIARRHQAALFLVHVLPPEPRYELPLEHQPDELNACKLEAARQFDALLQSSALADLVHEPILRCGALWETIQSVIADRAIDLIVVGTHGREGIRKLLLGSTAEVIFRNAACPVLTVGPHVSSELLATGMGRILFATDFSAASMSALPYA